MWKTFSCWKYRIQSFGVNLHFICAHGHDHGDLHQQSLQNVFQATRRFDASKQHRRSIRRFVDHGSVQRPLLYGLENCKGAARLCGPGHSNIFCRRKPSWYPLLAPLSTRKRWWSWRQLWSNRQSLQKYKVGSMKLCNMPVSDTVSALLQFLKHGAGRHASSYRAKRNAAK